MADVTINNLTGQAPSLTDVFPFSTTGVGPATYKASLAQVRTGLNLATVATTGNFSDLSGPYIVNGADTGPGNGWTVAQGADNSAVTGFTSRATPIVTFSFNLTDRGSIGRHIFDYGWASASYAIHTANFPGCIGVFVGNTPKVLNQIQWIKHSNACGNVDVFGSNDIFSTPDNCTFLGRTFFGGTGSATDGTVITQNFNSNGYGYRYYLFVIQDNNTTQLSYPNTGSTGAYAMYGMRLNKV